MLTISEEQWRRINAAYAQHRRRRFLAILRSERTSIPSGVSNEEAIETIDAVILDGAELDIEEDDDVLRLSRIAFAAKGGRITEEKSYLIATTISNVSVPCDDRLSFVEQRILAFPARRRGLGQE